MPSTTDKRRPPDRRRHRHGRRDLARRRQGRQLGEAHRRPVRHPARSPAFRPTALKTTIAGTVDFVPVEPFCRAGAVASGWPTWRPRKRSREAGIGQRGDFPGPLFLAVPPVEIEWPQRARAGGRPRGANDNVSYDDLLRAAATGRFAPLSRALPCSARSPSTSPTSSAPRARRSRCRPPAPRARPRSSSASRRSAAAKPTPRSASAPTARSIRNR